jgi:acyl-CoA reductase-like NAD-dependent aldehyde dehydrogenase
MQEHREVFAVWESIDQGKTLQRARVEVDRAISNFACVIHPMLPVLNLDSYKPQLFLDIHPPRADSGAYD